MLVEIYCVGRSPLLMNRMTEESLHGLRKPGGKKPKTAPRPELPRDEAIPKLYTTHDKKKRPYLPTENIFSCLVCAGQMVRLDGKRQISTAKSTILPSFITIVEPYVLLVDPDDGESEPAWEVDMRQGRNPNGGEAVCIVRPRFDRWAFRLTVDIDDREIAEAVIRELFDKAGARIGLGDFRPQRRGPFGQFIVNRWAKIQEAAAAE